MFFLHFCGYEENEDTQNRHFLESKGKLKIKVKPHFSFQEVLSATEQLLTTKKEQHCSSALVQVDLSKQF